MYWFCHISTRIHHRYTRVPHPKPSSLLPPHTIPLGRPSAPAPTIQYHASNLDWWFVSYMILYMFQCHSSFHPLPHPQSPKDCYIHLCLLLSRIQGYRYHLSKFHIYALVETVSDFIFLGSKITTDGDCSHETTDWFKAGKGVWQGCILSFYCEMPGWMKLKL